MNYVKSIGKSILDLSKMDMDEELSFVVSRIGRSPAFSKKNDLRIQGRGNPLLIRKRICTMEEIDRRILELY